MRARDSADDHLRKPANRAACGSYWATRDFLQGRCLARLGQVPGGTLSIGLPTRVRVWLTIGLQPAGFRDGVWLKKGLPCS